MNELKFHWRELSYNENDEDSIFFHPLYELYSGEIRFGDVQVRYYGKGRGWSLIFESSSLPFIYIPHIKVDSWEVEPEVVETYKKEIVKIIESKLAFK